MRTVSSSSFLAKSDKFNSKLISISNQTHLLEENNFLCIFSSHFFHSFIHLPLYDAREFSNERGRVERRAQFHKCRTSQMFTEAMTAYLNWIEQAGVSFIFFT